MATTTTICNSFKDEIGQAIHNLSSHQFKVALFTAAANLTAAVTSYAGLSGEIVNAGGTAYSPGGKNATKGAGGAGADLISAATNGGIAAWDWANVVWTEATFGGTEATNVKYALLYNDSLAGKNAVMFCTYDAPGRTCTAADFTVTIPETGIGALRFG